MNIGDIIRYDGGCTALMRIEHISKNHGGFGDRFYGEQLFGHACGAYERNCWPATDNDLLMWKEERARYHLEP